MAKLIFTSRYIRDAPPEHLQNYVRYISTREGRRLTTWVQTGPLWPDTSFCTSERITGRSHALGTGP